MFNITPTVRNLLLANIAVFLLQKSPQLGEQVTRLGSLYPLGSPFFGVWQFVTYMFLHSPDDWQHILFNMFGLISFGPLLEQRWGGQRFLAFWLICGVGAGVLYEGTRVYELHRMAQAAAEFHQLPGAAEFADFYHTYFPGASGAQIQAAVGELQANPHDATLIAQAQQALDSAVAYARDSPNAGMLGASGALFGVLLAFAYLFPNTELMMLFLPIPIKAKYLVGVYMLLELFQGVHRLPGDNVAHFAHLGGALVGFILVKIWERGRTQFY